MREKSLRELPGEQSPEFESPEEDEPTEEVDKVSFQKELKTRGLLKNLTPEEGHLLLQYIKAFKEANVSFEAMRCAGTKETRKQTPEYETWWNWTEKCRELEKQFTPSIKQIDELLDLGRMAGVKELVKKMEQYGIFDNVLLYQRPEEKMPSGSEGGNGKRTVSPETGERLRIVNHYQNLQLKVAAVKKQLGLLKFWDFLERNSLNHDLEVLQNLLEQYQKTYPYLKGVPPPSVTADLGTPAGREKERGILLAGLPHTSRKMRSEFLGRYVATLRADLAQEAEHPEWQELDLAQQGYNFWLEKLRELSRERVNLLNVWTRPKRKKEIEERLEYYRRILKKQKAKE